MIASATDISAPDFDAMEVTNTVTMALNMLNAPNSAANKLFSPSGTLLCQREQDCGMPGIGRACEIDRHFV